MPIPWTNPRLVVDSNCPHDAHRLTVQIRATSADNNITRIDVTNGCTQAARMIVGALGQENTFEIPASFDSQFTRQGIIALFGGDLTFNTITKLEGPWFV